MEEIGEITLKLIPDKEIDEIISSHWLIGKLFTDKHADGNAVKDMTQKSWGPDSEVHIEDAGNNIYVFVFEKIEDRDYVLGLAPWSNTDFLLVLGAWEKDKIISEIGVDKTPLWIQVVGLPPNRYTEENAKKIAAVIGRFLQVDPMCLSKKQWKPCLRMRVEVDVSKALKPGFKLERDDGSIVFIQFKYELLCDFCYNCGLIGHGVNTCKMEMQSNGKYGPHLKARPWMTSYEQPHGVHNFGNQMTDSNDNLVVENEPLRQLDRSKDNLVVENESRRDSLDAESETLRQSDSSKDNLVVENESPRQPDSFKGNLGGQSPSDNWVVDNKPMKQSDSSMDNLVVENELPRHSYSSKGNLGLQFSSNNLISENELPMQSYCCKDNCELPRQSYSSKGNLVQQSLSGNWVVENDLPRQSYNLKANWLVENETRRQLACERQPVDLGALLTRSSNLVSSPIKKVTAGMTGISVPSNSKMMPFIMKTRVHYTGGAHETVQKGLAGETRGKGMVGYAPEGSQFNAHKSRTELVDGQNLLTRIYTCGLAKPSIQPKREIDMMRKRDKCGKRGKRGKRGQNLF